MPQVSRLADEVLLLDTRRGHSGLHHVVLGLELVAVGAVGLLQAPRRAVYADSAWREAVWLPGLPEQVPELEALFLGQIQCPADIPNLRLRRGTDTSRRHPVLL